MIRCLSALRFRRGEAGPFGMLVFIQYAALRVLQTSPFPAFLLTDNVFFAVIYNVQITVTGTTVVTTI